MSKMADFEAGIRKIVQEELEKEKLATQKKLNRYDINPYLNPQYSKDRRTSENGRDGVKWSTFETENLIAEFWSFCNDRAFKIGRTPRSISCKIRNLMHLGTIETW